MQPRRRATLAGSVVAVGAAALAVVVSLDGSDDRLEAAGRGPSERTEAQTVRLAFAGDVHFEDDLRPVLARRDSTLGPMSDVLSAADLAMVNLEAPVTDATKRSPKEREDPGNRFWFRTDRRALDVLDRSGVDVASVANNHAGDYGVDGVRDTLRAGESGPIALVGAGLDERQAFAPQRFRVKDNDIAVHAADASPREGASPVWGTVPGSGPGVASARGTNTRQLLTAVRQSAERDDVVVVYLHWGEEGNACSTQTQEGLARQLAKAGADVVVGTHAHTPVGSGSLGDSDDATYVSYGLGNFFWYHGREDRAGVLQLDVREGRVVADEWVPARIGDTGGSPRPLSGEAAEKAVERWDDLRDCTDLSPGPGPAQEPVPSGDVELPTFASTVTRIGASVRSGIDSHAESCPVPLADLRHVTVSYVGFDDRAHRGELVLDADVAVDVVGVFEKLYEARFPIDRMRLIDDFGGDDDASMAANNTSAYNCRRVAGTSRWSDHAYGRAVDINPVQNPYVVGNDVRPGAARDFLDRSQGDPSDRGVIVDGGVVREAFKDIGWEWGGLYPEPDYQHFSSPPP